jgi:CDP-glycerol glycerophosphotransferase (TagB/SpsB family)
MSGLRSRAHREWGRLRRSRPADRVKQRLWHPLVDRHEPLVSVVVPFHDARRQLGTTLESLLAQHHRKLEVILVDDGSTDGSREVALRYSAAHHRIRVLEQEHAGVGAARNRGAAAARGTYLAFCDAGDLVLPSGYARLVAALDASGSDVAVGSVALEVKGRFEEPGWARRSNSVRQLGSRLDDVPQLLGNLMMGPRLFRRSFWQAQGLRFGDDERSDPRVVVSSLLAARTVDVLPAVVYRWSWREDNRSLLQRDLVDKDRVAERVRAVREPGRLLVESGSERLQQLYFAEVLHSVVADLVRAAVCRDDGYWEALTTELAPLVTAMSSETSAFVPVEDRVIAWLCAHDERQATEDFLEYAFDNRSGYPFRVHDGRPSIALPFIDALDGTSPDLTRVAASDMPFRARLTRLGWVADGVLGLEGGAFVEYVDDRVGPSAVAVVLVDQQTQVEHRFDAAPLPDVNVNQWAGRANEDHTGGGFSVELDLRSLEADGQEPRRFNVLVELSIGERTVRGGFTGRLASASPGLLEASVADGRELDLAWREHRGLGVVVRPTVRGVGSRGGRPAGTSGQGTVTVDTLEADLHLLHVQGTCAGPSGNDLELSLSGPRGQTRWFSAVRDADDPQRFRADLSVLVDEWGLGETSVPADTYQVRARVGGGLEQPAACARSLWQALPRPIDSGRWTFVPQVDRDGALLVRVVPVEWQHSRPAFLRRRLRDEVYPAAKEQPLLDTVLFETFAGKGTGDNPGAICAELHRRDLGLDLVYSVLDHSHVVPDGARAVVRWSPEWFELLGRARYLVVNASLPYFFRKREGQLYYQTWHGTPLKRIAHDRPHLDFFNWHHRRQLLVARSGWDFLLSQSDFCGQALSSAFRYDGPLMQVGYPRNDVLLSPGRDEVRRRVRAHFGIADASRVVLYAPTWRDNLRVGAVFNKVLYLQPEELVHALGDAVVLVRGHYNSVGAPEDRGAPERVIDVTRYPDIADLYLAADAMVTDYSSVFFDFSLTDKPMVFLAPDLEEYRDDNRGFYLDYHDVVPGPVCLTTAEVATALAGPDAFAEQRRSFRARFNPLDDGHAAGRVVDRVLEAFPLGAPSPTRSSGVPVQ